MNQSEMFGSARWITASGSPDAAFFRDEFEAREGERAEITICGLGFFELYINGARVGDDCFVPAVSDYAERPEMRGTLSYPISDSMRHRIYCLKYDITDFLADGRNVIGVTVGGGYYHQVMRKAEGNTNYGDICLCYNIDLGGRNVVSGAGVKWNRGFFRRANLYYGEMHDYTGFDRGWNTLAARNEGWESCVEIDAPQSDLLLQTCPVDRVTDIVAPELVKRNGDYSVYAVPENISGYVVVRCSKPGERVQLECAEDLDGNGEIDNMSVGYGRVRQIAEFITDGSDEPYHQYFTWFGFRYFTLTNNAEPVEVRVIHSDVAVTSDFECSDATLNWFYRAYINTQLCNMHGGVPSDCPHRERLGYTGDGQLCCDAAMTMLDARGFYEKWIEDIFDCQDLGTGHVQHTAPFQGGGGGPAGWGGAVIVAPYIFYRHYGDVELLKKAYPRMKLFISYMQSRTEDGLIVREEDGGWCLGDWCTPEKIVIPEPLVNTAMFISQLELVNYCAGVLGEDDSFDDLIEEYRNAVRRNYFNEESASCFDGIQGADAFYYDACCRDGRVLKNIVEKYEKLGEFDTGIFGTYILLRTLFETGNGETAVKLLAGRGDVSFDAMRRRGATTIWENWDGSHSHSHPMFGASAQYLFDYLLGIRQNDDSVGYERVTISPVFASPLSHARGHITTPRGRISVAWKRTGESVEVEVDADERIDAVFCFGDVKRKILPGKNVIKI